MKNSVPLFLEPDGQLEEPPKPCNCQICNPGIVAEDAFLTAIENRRPRIEADRRTRPSKVLELA